MEFLKTGGGPKRKILIDLAGDPEIVESLHEDIINRLASLGWEPV